MASADCTRRGFLTGIAALAGASFLPGRAWAEGASFTLSNARILTGDGKALDGGVRVEAGRIAALGAVTRQDPGQTLWPGMWLAAAPIGCSRWVSSPGRRRVRGSDAVVPQVAHDASTHAAR